MRVNMNTTKVIICGEWQKVTEKAVRWPCCVSGIGVDNNSIQCTSWWGAGMVICLRQGADMHMARLIPLPLTISCSSKSRLVLP